uniref:hypothetical protein n=1 Tax=Xanthomonas oryzae TaxID=347 RepID=UPI003DA0911D
MVTEQFLDITNNLPADMTRQLPSGLLGLPRPTSVPTIAGSGPPPPEGAAQYLRFAGVRRGRGLGAVARPLAAPAHRIGAADATVVGKAGEVVDTDEMGASWSRCTGRWRRSTPRAAPTTTSVQHARALCLPLGQ